MGRYLKYSKNYKMRDGYEYNYNNKRIRLNESVDDVIVCVDDSGQSNIKFGESYIITEVDDVGMKVNNIDVFYRYDRFMPLAEYREMIIDEVLIDEVIK
jgi:hypothetical protein